MLSFKFQFTWEVWISVSFLSRKSSLERLRDNLNWKFAEVLHLLTIPEKVSDLVWQADSISVVKHVHYLHSSLTKLHFRLDTVLIDKNLWGSNAHQHYPWNNIVLKLNTLKKPTIEMEVILTWTALLIYLRFVTSIALCMFIVSPLFRSRQTHAIHKLSQDITMTVL